MSVIGREDNEKLWDYVDYDVGVNMSKREADKKLQCIVKPG